MWVRVPPSRLLHSWRTPSFLSLPAGRNNRPVFLKGVTEAVTREQFKKLEAKHEEQIKDEKQKVIDAGGLKIIGTERHESRRIDNQLRGRSGRQGDPGDSKFYISLEDNLMKIFGGDRVTKVYSALNVDEN